MTQESKVLSIVGTVTVAILVGAVFILSGNSSTSPASNKKADPEILVRPDSNRIGTDSAKITLVEFGDYQCPACGAAYPIVKRIIDEYSGELNFVFRNFSFLGPESDWAAQAAECAGEQGKFWQYYGYIYEHQSGENQGTFSKDNLKSFAKTLSLDVSNFSTCLDSGKYLNKVVLDTSDGKTLGVNSTPTFFLNGEKIVGVPNYSDLKQKIDTILK